jgi:hypothetical protein
MSAGVCPSCGVAVVPGYVRCPKCHKPLPRRAKTFAEGGTAVQPARKFPVAALIGAVAIGGVIVYLALRGNDNKPASPPAVPVEAPEREVPEVTQPTGPEAETPTVQIGPNAQAVASELEKALKRQRLWSTVSVTGERVEVRSGSCSDPAMAPLLDEAAPSFKAAGLSKLRCVEQSGRVVSDRDL